MNINRSVVHRFPFLATIHWQLLIFLLLFLNVKLAVKATAIIFIYLAQPDFRFRISFKNPRIPLFYPAVIVIAALNFFWYRQLHSLNYFVVLITALGLWGMNLLTVHQLKNITEKTDTQKIYNTIVIFFMLNTAISFATLLGIIIETGHINPFRYQGEYQKYFISTGDYIKGLSFDTSTTNAALNAFGVLFFLEKKKTLLVLMCFATLLLSAANMINIVLLLILIVLFIVKSSSNQKTVIVITTAMLVTFMVRVSPQNDIYVADFFSKYLGIQTGIKEVWEKKVDLRTIPDDSLSYDKRREKFAILSLDSINKHILPTIKKDTIAVMAGIDPIQNQKIEIPQPSIHSAPFQRRDDTNAVRKEMISFVNRKKEIKKSEDKYAEMKLPGKAIALLQTASYVKANPKYWLTGKGAGTFSSKVAFKATAMRFAGGFPQRFIYINPDFAVNHLSLYLYFFTEHSKKHSVTNSPNSVYDQLITEYGAAGLLAFVSLYVLFFAKQYKKLSYGIPIFFLLLCLLGTDYWFEQLSVISFAELLLFLNIKEKEVAV